MNWLLLALLAPPSAEARRIAEELLIADANILTPYRITLDPADLLERTDRGEFDVPRAREGGLNVAVLGILVPGTELEPKRYADAGIDTMLALAARSQDVSLVTRPGQARPGTLGLLLAIENGAALENDLASVRYFYDRGVRLITLVHSRPNALGDSSYSRERPWNGLSPFGRDVVAAMNRVGMLIDVSHIADEAFHRSRRVEPPSSPPTPPVVASLRAGSGT